jgi:long-chain acyl-CoA synthetase
MTVHFLRESNIKRRDKVTTNEKPWLKHYPPEIAASSEYPDVLVPFLLEDAYQKKPHNIAIRFLGKSITYKELYESSLAFANSLSQMGVEAGDRVSIMLPNCPQAVIGYYGVMLAGGIVVQTNPLYVERELEHQLNDSGAETIVALDLVYPKVAGVRSKTPLKNVIITSIKDYLPFPKNFLYPLVQKKQGIKVNITYGEEIKSFVQLVKQGELKPILLEQKQDDVALLQYTGGTTGLPKGVMLTHRNLVVNTYQCVHWMHKAEYGKERSLGIVPFFHVYGMTVVMNLTISLASSMILLPKFDVNDALKTIDKEKPTLFCGAPTMYIALLNHPEISKYNLSSIKACLSGSAPLPVEVQQKFQEVTKGSLVEGYGLTETSPVTHANLIWGKNRIGSIGIPWPDTEAKVLSLDTKEPVVSGEIGEIAIRGPQVMKGYWNRPEATAETFQEDWFLTGDMGYMDEEGYFYIVDRKKDLIIAGGFNIYPREIEEILYEHPAVKECVVAGISDPYRGETVKAYIIKKEGQDITEQELDAYCRKTLASYKVPRIYEFREELPKSMIGKILRRVLVEEEKKKAVEAEKKVEAGPTSS